MYSGRAVRERDVGPLARPCECSSLVENLLRPVCFSQDECQPKSLEFAERGRINRASCCDLQRSDIGNPDMRMDKLTSRFQQALADAQSLAVRRDHNLLEPTHVMAALLDQQGGSTAP